MNPRRSIDRAGSFEDSVSVRQASPTPVRERMEGWFTGDSLDYPWYRMGYIPSLGNTFPGNLTINLDSQFRDPPSTPQGVHAAVGAQIQRKILETVPRPSTYHLIQPSLRGVPGRTAGSTQWTGFGMGHIVDASPATLVSGDSLSVPPICCSD